MPSPITETLTALIDLLEPLSSEERHRAISAAMLAIGDTQIDLSSNNASINPVATEPHKASTRSSELVSHKRVLTWMKQHAVSEKEIESVFHIDTDDVEIIAASIPGSKSGQKSRNAYLLQGIAEFLRTGEPSFDDRSARDLCDRYGFYDAGNHSHYMKAMGNKLAGSKQSGWKLTGPGLVAAADLLGSMS